MNEIPKAVFSRTGSVGKALDLQLLSARRFEGGAIAHVYQPA